MYNIYSLDVPGENVGRMEWPMTFSATNSRSQDQCSIKRYVVCYVNEGAFRRLEMRMSLNNTAAYRL